MKNIANYIEHTNVNPDATEDDIRRLCEEAIKYNFYGVCVNTTYVNLAYSLLKDTEVKLIQTVGFPFGSSNKKADEISPHANEIDMVINIALLKSRKYEEVISDIERVKKAAKNKKVKVIIETALLIPEEIGLAAFVCEAAGADFIKTNTGFFKPRPRSLLDDIILVKSVTSLPIKASGGIRTYQDAIELVRMGVQRIGTSRGVEIIRGEANEER